MRGVPFSAEQFFAVFSAYNAAVWPAQVGLLAAALGAVVVALTRPESRHRWVSGFLAALWAWTGIVYHIAHFSAVNPAATGFGALFLVQSALFLWWGVLRNRLEYGRRTGVRGAAAAGILLYALVVYPLLGALAGHAYMDGPTFGAPCPAVIYTFGVLLLAASVPAWLLVVPVLWALIGSTAVMAFGVYQDLGLILSALIVVALMVRGRQRPARSGRVPESVATRGTSGASSSASGGRARTGPSAG